MSSKLDSLIAGLTMLRAYGCVTSLCPQGGEGNGLLVYVDSSVAIHPQDVARLTLEGWAFDEGGVAWVFECI